MRSTHNTIRALVIGIGLTLLVITGTAAMMAAFSGTVPAPGMYRRVAISPTFEPAAYRATGHDTVLYERVVLADGRAQWMLTEEPGTSLSTLPQGEEPATTVANNTTPSIYAGAARAVSYTLVVKPTGLSKAIKNCIHSTYDVYDIACTTVS